VDSILISNYISGIAMSNNTPILVTGAAGNVGSIGRIVVKLLRAAAAAKEIPDFEILVNIPQMTVSQMSLTEMTESRQQQQHWLGEQVLNWSGVTVVHVRSRVFLEPLFSSMAASSITKDGTIRFPFGSARTSSIFASDVARVVSTILEDTTGHRGKVYELTVLDQKT
jgi:NAD(P)H dehydrogenase (quinone)